MKIFSCMLLIVGTTMFCSAQKLVTTQQTNYLREGPASYFPIIEMLPNKTEVTKVDQTGSWLKVEVQQDLGWLSENSFVNRKGNEQRDLDMIKGRTSSRASRAELAAAVKGFGQKYVEGSGELNEDISKYSKPEVTPEEMEKFEHSFTIEPFRGYMKVEKPFDIYFHEEGIGLGIAEKIAAQKGLVDDERATRYINLIGNYLSQFTKAYDLGFRYYILNDNRASAFSCPGGYVFITKGILQICSNESELAGVIAHEMVHIIQRHGLKELHLNEAKIKANKAFEELDEDTGGMTDEEKDLESYADNAYQNIISPRLLKYELEADEIAMQYLYRAGYDPTSVVSVLEKIYQAPTAHPDIFDDNYMKTDDMQERLIKARSEVRDEGYRSDTKKHFDSRFDFYTKSIRQ